MPYVSPTPSPTSSWAATAIITNFILSYVVCSTRLPKRWLGFDHNVSPREDVAKYGEGMVRQGKMNDRELGRLKRWESLYANAVENFPLFFGSVIFALHAGVPNTTINGLCATYTLARIGYGVAYIVIDKEQMSWVRTACWWAGNVSALTLVGKAGGRLNALL